MFIIGLAMELSNLKMSLSRVKNIRGMLNRFE